MSTTSSTNRLSGVAVLGIILLISMLVVDVIALFLHLSLSTTSGQSPNGSQGSGTTQNAQATSTAQAMQATQATATAQATQAVQVTTTATVQATQTATHTPTSNKELPVIVPFSGGGSAVQTTLSYTGPTKITISGTGQAAGTQFSDAFYIYTDGQGRNIPTTPAPRIAGLCINGQPIDSFVSSIPAYDPTHIYKVTLNAPGGTVTFGVCDTILTDNTGAFVILFD